MSFSNYLARPVRRFARFANSAYTARLATHANALVAYAKLCTDEPALQAFAGHASQLLRSYGIYNPPAQASERLPQPSIHDTGILPHEFTDTWREILSDTAKRYYSNYRGVVDVAQGSHAGLTAGLTRRRNTIYDRYGRAIVRVPNPKLVEQVHVLLAAHWIDEPLSVTHEPAQPADHEQPDDDDDFL